MYVIKYQEGGKRNGNRGSWNVQNIKSDRLLVNYNSRFKSPINFGVIWLAVRMYKYLKKQ